MLVDGWLAPVADLPRAIDANVPVITPTRQRANPDALTCKSSRAATPSEIAGSKGRIRQPIASSSHRMNQRLAARILIALLLVAPFSNAAAGPWYAASPNTYGWRFMTPEESISGACAASPRMRNARPIKPSITL